MDGKKGFKNSPPILRGSQKTISVRSQKTKKIRNIKHLLYSKKEKPKQKSIRELTVNNINIQLYRKKKCKFFSIFTHLPPTPNLDSGYVIFVSFLGSGFYTWIRTSWVKVALQARFPHWIHLEHSPGSQPVPRQLRWVRKKKKPLVK